MSSKSFLGIHHIKLPAVDFRKTIEFYTTHLPFVHISDLDHIHPDTHAVYAVILQHKPSSLHIEIRDAADQAIKQKGFDPVTWAVETRQDLEEWSVYFERCGVKHSKVFTGAKGWLLVAEDPDGRFVRFYSLESHEMTSDTDRDAYWLGN